MHGTNVKKCEKMKKNVKIIIFLSVNIYMFRAAMAPSTGDTTVFMRHLVLVILYGWLSGMQGWNPAYQTVIHTEWQIPSVA